MIRVLLTLAVVKLLMSQQIHVVVKTHVLVTVNVIIVSVVLVNVIAIQKNVARSALF